jgi:hypothetical protein
MKNYGDFDFIKDHLFSPKAPYSVRSASDRANCSNC